MSEEIVVREGVDSMELYQESVAGVLGAGGMSLDVIPRITLKHAGAVGFGIESVEGEDERLVSGSEGFDGTILYIHPFRVYWDTPFDERDEDDPFPACSSMDGLTGWMKEDERERSCADCPHSKWGSAGRGQACRERSRIFLLPTFSEGLPHRLDIPTTSVAVPKKYVMGLFGKKLGYWQAVTHFGAEKATNRAGIDYSKLLLSLDSQLEAEAVAKLQAMRDGCVLASAAIPLADGGGEFSEDGEVEFE